MGFENNDVTFLSLSFGVNSIPTCNNCKISTGNATDKTLFLINEVRKHLLDAKFNVIIGQGIHQIVYLHVGMCEL